MSEKPADTDYKGLALYWLDKALALEAEGKPARLIDMALDKACAFELKSFAS